MVIAQVREIHGMSQRKLATATGIEQAALARMETRQRKVNVLDLEKIATAFGMSTSALVARAEISAVNDVEGTEEFGANGGSDDGEYD